MGWPSAFMCVASSVLRYTEGYGSTCMLLCWNIVRILEMGREESVGICFSKKFLAQVYLGDTLHHDGVNSSNVIIHHTIVSSSW